MRYILFASLFFAAACADMKNSTLFMPPFAMDTSWKKHIISDVLTVSLPDSVIYEDMGALKATYANGNEGWYGVDHFDTLVVIVNNQQDFRNALSGFIYGKLKDSSMAAFDMLVSDTSIAGTKGLFITGKTDNEKQSCKFSFCYLTLADNMFYWFYACQPLPEMSDETRQFFYSIEFATDKIKESSYTLQRMQSHKKAQ